MKTWFLLNSWLLSHYFVIYSCEQKLATGFGSNPNVANIIGLLLDSIVSGLVYDTVKSVFEKGIVSMKKEILFLGLGVCGDMV